MARLPSALVRDLIRLARSPCALVFDFDGTLAPIVARPEDAVLDHATRDSLRKLTPRYPCALLSGRARHDVVRRVQGVGFAAVIGNHGLDDGRRAPDPILRRWARELRRRLADEPGVRIEDKRYSLSVHYRASPRPAQAQRRAHTAITRLGAARVVAGKRVLNVLPPTTRDKASALRELLARNGVARALYLGDDATDEPAFAVRGVLGVRVGRSLRGSAAPHLISRAQVRDLIELLVELRSTGSMPASARSKRPSPVESGGHVLEFLRQLWAVDHALQRRSKQMLSERGVTGPQRLALRLLLLGPGMSAGELAAAMHVHPSTLTGVLERLERRKLIRRRARPGDLRSVELHATAAGADIVRETRGTVEDAVRRSLARHSQRELDVARDVLRELEQELLGE